MANWLEIFLLSIVQGLTEFLPVSSSAHLVLLPKLLNWQDQGLAVDVALHVGTLLALLLFFKQDISRLSTAWVQSCLGHALNEQKKQESKLAWFVIAGSVPVAIFGAIGHQWISMVGRSTWLIATATIGFGLLLGLASWYHQNNPTRDEYSLCFKDVLWIGLAQALALIPGASRSGITLTAGFWVGLSRQAAARYSFLLAVPAIVMAGSHQGMKLLTTAAPVHWPLLITGTVIAAIVGYACIGGFLRLLERSGVLPFVIYRLLLGVIILCWL